MITKVDMTSVFCGAGGDAQGARRAGIEVKIATNHWQRAIETHAANFPKTEHICADVSQVDPKRWPSTQVAWFSPECPYHSNAAGRAHAPGQRSFFDPAVDLAAVRSRATMWEVCRFSEVHHYQVVIVENVTEVRKWRLFPAWLQAMRLLDYDYKFCYHNSQFFGVPQSRDRVYMVFWKKGMRKPNLDFRPDAYCVSCSKQVKAVQSWKPKCHSRKYGLHYIYCCPQCSERVYPFYTPAATVIDWADPGEPVLKPGRNLAPATIKRIKAGLKKYGHRTLIIQTSYSKAGDKRVHATNVPLPTQTARQSVSVSFPPGALVVLRNNMDAKPLNSPLTTISAGGIHNGVVQAPFVQLNYTPGYHKETTEPLATITATDHHSIVWPEPFLVSYNGNACYASVVDPLLTISTVQRHALVQGAAPKLEDCHYRMLKPPEIGKGQGFEDDYIVLGNQREQVRQYGNAVPPGNAFWLWNRCGEILD